MAKKQGRNRGGERFFGVDSVAGSCVMGNVTVSATVSVPANAVEKNIFASVLKASDLSVVASPKPMTPLSGDDYSASFSGLGPGAYKAKVNANWHVPDSSDGISAQFNCSAGPSPRGAAGPDDCRG